MYHINENPLIPVPINFYEFSGFITWLDAMFWQRASEFACVSITLIRTKSMT